MLDQFNWPIPKTQIAIIYPSAGAVIDGHVQVWHKPRNVRMVSILAIAAGGGGGYGHQRTAGTAGGGGGGGGAGGQFQGIFPAYLLPDVLYIHVGTGGKGATTANGGASGGSAATIVQVSRENANSTGLFSVAVGGLGNNGALGSAGSGGSGGNAASASTVRLLGLAIFGTALNPTSPGVAGGAQTGAVGTDIAIGTAGRLATGGAGGGGAQSADFSGGSVTVPANSLLAESVPTNPVPDGSHGSMTWAPFYSLGGGGGQAVNGGQGGNGGNGNFGSGGGGGGCGTTRGAGGNGGDGICIIRAW